MKMVNGERENKNSVVTKKCNTYEHDLRIDVNKMTREAKEHGIPIFIAFYSPLDGYVYNAVLPEEVEDENLAKDLESEYGKFNKFLRICMDFNREEFLGSEIIKTY